jgi:hypothetical protein
MPTLLRSANETSVLQPDTAMMEMEAVEEARDMALTNTCRLTKSRQGSIKEVWKRITLALLN